MKTLIVGDIHGCWDEFAALLEQAALSADDVIISVGDIVDRGPDSPRVLAFFRDTPNASAIMGNHERKHVRAAKGETDPAQSQIITGLQFGDDYPAALQYMESLPAYLQLDAVDIVHGFFEPGVALEDQRPTVIIGTMSGETRSANSARRPSLVRPSTTAKNRWSSGIATIWLRRCRCSTPPRMRLASSGWIQAAFTAAR